MICPNCNAQIANDSKFCTKCGTNLANMQAEPMQAPQGTQESASTQQMNIPVKKSGWGKKHTIITIIIAMLLVAIIIGAVIFIKSRNNKMVNSRDYERDTSVKSEDIVEDDESEESDAEVEEDTLDYDEFRIDFNTVEDFSANLNPSEYYYYDSHIGLMNFYYPAKLFDTVYANDLNNQSAYGTCIKMVEFYGSIDSYLEFSVHERIDLSPIAEATDVFNNYEKNNYRNMSEILVDRENGKIVLAGNTASGKGCYDLLKIDDKYVYKMTFETTPYQSEEERLQQAYVIECVYRMCGFSGSTKGPRSYDEFLAEQ